MKLIDIKSRNEKEVAGIQTKVKKLAKKAGCNVGSLTFSAEGAMHYIELENDGGLSDEIADIIKKSPNGVLQSAKDYKGTYDWAADVYIRPCSVVSFTF